MNEKFNRDLEEWMLYENKVIEKLNSLGYSVNKNEDEKWVDIIWYDLDWKPVRIEVKRDNKSKDTGNYFFETSCRSKPSGLFKYDDVTDWIQWIDEYFCIYEKKLLDELVLSKWYKLRGWDNKASWWYILPTKKVEWIAKEKIFFNNKEDVYKSETI